MQETGDPPPQNRPSTLPSGRTADANVDVLIYKTKVEGLSYKLIQDTPGLTDQLDEKFKPVFAAAAGGVALSSVSMIYDSGSLLVTAEIIADSEHEVLDQAATSLPTAAAVLDAVKSVPDIKKAVIPGRGGLDALAAADPIGVRYAPGVEGNAAIETPPPPTPPTAPTPTPTPTPTPPPPSPAEESEDEENSTRTSSAHTSVVGWQVLPLCLAIWTFIFVH